MNADRIEGLRTAAARRQARDSEIIACTLLLRDDPRNAELYYRRGNAHRQNGQLVPAVCDFNHALALAPGYAEAYFYKAIACAALGCRLDEARAYRLFLSCAGAEATGLVGRVQRRLRQIERSRVFRRIPVR